MTTMTTTSTTATSTVAGTTTKHKTSIEFPDVDSALEKATKYWNEKLESFEAKVNRIIWICFFLLAFGFLILLCLGCYACCNWFNWHSVNVFQGWLSNSGFCAKIREVQMLYLERGGGVSTVGCFIEKWTSLSKWSNIVWGAQELTGGKIASYSSHLTN